MKIQKIAKVYLEATVCTDLLGIQHREGAFTKVMTCFQSLLSQLEIQGAGVLLEWMLIKVPKIFYLCLVTSSTASYILKPQNVLLSLRKHQAVHNEIDEYDLEGNGLKWDVAMILNENESFTRSLGRKKLQFVIQKEPLYECYDKSLPRVWGSSDMKDLSYGNGVLQDVFMNKESEIENQPLYDSIEPSELVFEPVVNESNVKSQPKVWSDAPIIKEYESDGDDECVVIPTKQQATPSFAKQQVKTPREETCLRDYPHRALKNKGIVDSGCSRHMTGNKAYLDEFQDFNGGPVAFGGSKGYITGKGKIKTGKLDFEDVCFVKELQHFNLFSVSQMCDKKNKVLFTDSECLVLSSEFKLPDENQVLLKIPRQNNMYSFNLENIVPSGGLACLIAKATTDESNKWHRRLGHVNFKNLNKLVKGNLVRGLPSKIFQNDHTCVACQKGKQHKASCKAKAVSSISHTLQLLHMDLFGPTSVRSLNHKTYCLVITDDFSRFSWVFFLRTKDETSAILKDFIRQIENQLNQKVKTIRSDNGTEFKNKDVIKLCGLKGINREYSNARTPQ
ncbi:putative ribonuclease H-like domain-containing protein [Tanacetum coccineum]